MSMKSRAVYIEEYEIGGVAWIRIRYKSHRTEVIMTREEFERNGNKVS